MTDEIVQAIINNPGDEDAYLVLADTLGPGGELVVLQHRIAHADAYEPDVVEREIELRSTIEAELRRHAPVDFVWHMGFIRELSIDVSQREAPRGDLRPILEHPCVRFAQSLALEMEWDTGDQVIGVLAERSHPALRHLELVEHHGDPSCNCDGTTAKLWPQLPNLESAFMRSERALFREMAHPKVRTLELEIAPFGNDGWHWDLPALESLAWDPHIESECDIWAIGSLFEQTLPALRTVRLTGVLMNDREPLFDNDHVRRFVSTLERFELPARAITNRDLAEHLLANANHIEHLSLVLNKARGPGSSALRSRLPKLELD